MAPLGDFSIKAEPYGPMWDRLYLGMSQDSKFKIGPLVNIFEWQFMYMSS